MAHKCPVTHLTQAAVAYALSCDIGSTVTPEASRRNGPGWMRRSRRLCYWTVQSSAWYFLHKLQMIMLYLGCVSMLYNIGHSYRMLYTCLIWYYMILGWYLHCKKCLPIIEMQHRKLNLWSGGNGNSSDTYTNPRSGWINRTVSGIRSHWNLTCLVVDSKHLSCWRSLSHWKRSSSRLFQLLVKPDFR